MPADRRYRVRKPWGRTEVRPHWFAREGSLRNAPHAGCHGPVDGVGAALCAGLDSIRHDSRSDAAAEAEAQRRPLLRSARVPGLYRQVVRAGAQPRAKPPDDALRAPADLGLVGTQCARDRVKRLAIEKHREHR